MQIQICYILLIIFSYIKGTTCYKLCSHTKSLRKENSKRGDIHLDAYYNLVIVLEEGQNVMT